MNTSLMSILNEISNGADFSIKKINGSYSVTLQKGTDLVSIDIDRKTITEDLFKDALNRISKLIDIKFKS